MRPRKTLDEIDRRLLRELQENARLSYSELGRRVALTPPAVAERIRRIEESGIITGYRLELDMVRLGLPVTAFVQVTAPSEATCARLGAAAREWPEVLECHRLTGDTSYLMKVAVDSVRHLEALIDRILPYGLPATSIVLSSPVRHRVVDPGEPRAADDGDGPAPRRTGGAPGSPPGRGLLRRGGPAGGRGP